MSHLGLGVMLNMLFGNHNAAEVYKKSIGQKILRLYLVDNALHFELEDGYKMKLFDNGQSCCEIRYVHTDDNLNDFIGATLTGIEEREAPD